MRFRNALTSFAQPARRLMNAAALPRQHRHCAALPMPLHPEIDPAARFGWPDG
jgi:hypothetical protein